MSKIKNQNEGTENKEKITPSQYFNYIKNVKHTITNEKLKESFSNFIYLAEKYKKTGQLESIKKLSYLATTIVKEEKLISMGITTFIYRDDIQDYIEQVADNTVKVVELSRYTREIPDELITTIEKTKDIFDQMYVVFTDYTGKEERKVDKERRDKDPILFGVFKNNTCLSERFYFLGDWVDEYCDLTIDKLVSQYKDKKNIDILQNTVIPETSDELVELLKQYTPTKKIENTVVSNELMYVGDMDTPAANTNNTVKIDLGAYKKTNSDTKKGLISKVKSVFSKKDK